MFKSSKKRLVVYVKELDQAKHVAGEWVAMFNQFPTPTVQIPFHVCIRNVDKHYGVMGQWFDRHKFTQEDYLEALSVLDDFCGEEEV